MEPQLGGSDNETVCIPNPQVRDLAPDSMRRSAQLLTRAFRLRCPLCDSYGVFSGLFSLVQCCPRCGYRFMREEGYFLGAYALNLVVAEVLGLGLFIVWLLRSNFSLLAQEFVAISAAIVLPIIFFPFARALWMAIDILFHPVAAGR